MTTPDHPLDWFVRNNAHTTAKRMEMADTYLHKVGEIRAERSFITGQKDIVTLRAKDALLPTHKL